MKVALGTLELDEDTRKKLGKATIVSSYLKRDQARDWALGLINGELDKIRAGSPAVPAPVQSNGDSQPEYLPEPPTAPKDADHLPEPAPPTGAAGGTTPTATGTTSTTGGLGSAGIPGGTV